MAVVKMEPVEHPLPYDLKDEPTPASFAEELMVAASTADLLEQLGAAPPPEIDKTTLEEEKKLLEATIRKQKTTPLKSLPVAMGAAAFLKEYGQNLALDVAQTRAAITTKLMEIANCGDIKYELKALELLGKHSDIGLFTERSEVTINYKNPEELENAIKERVKRLLSADVVDMKPLGMDLDEELGILDADFEEVSEVEEPEEEEGEDEA